jgi:branched-chain amino acid aminotransferase
VRADVAIDGDTIVAVGTDVGAARRTIDADGRLVTPTPHNFLDGITRRAVMGMARKRGWAVEERDVMPEELARASEVFLCGSAAEIVPVGSIDQHHFQAGPVAKTLMADFHKLVREPDIINGDYSIHWLEKYLASLGH